ncbi:MAG TPA: 50S ribosomal protein L3 [Nitrososphaeraceae archaeon]|nr:50S ribosomal protein L3 [Nitrososphaeraceae archaeon]
MGHRKYSAPRRGSVAYRPRARARSLEARVRNWAQSSEPKPVLGAFAGYKVGMLSVVTVDDRDRTPNFGKQLANPATLLATPPLTVVGIRGYRVDYSGRHALFDVGSRESIRDQKKKVQQGSLDKSMSKAEGYLSQVSHVYVLVSVSPKDAGLSQKKPYTFEIQLTGGNSQQNFDYAKSIIGKKLKVTDIFRTGQLIDVAAITRGKGVEGPITRFGVKKKQHKSRKSVRAVGTLGPISPAVVMFTVPRQGQRGFHQRIEYNKRILLIGNTSEEGLDFNRKGGFKHFGTLNGDFIVVRGSIPGVPKRLIKLRMPIRQKKNTRILEPKIVEMVVG